MRATTAHGAGREFKSFDWSKRMRKRCGNGVWLAMWVFSIGSWGVALADGPGVEVTARLEADALTPGSAGAVMVSYALADGFVIAPDGMVAPIVQVAVPDSVKLDGAVLTDHKKLARNDFLHAPYELAMKQPTQRIAFTVQSPPAADAHIGLNFIALPAHPNRGRALCAPAPGSAIEVARPRCHRAIAGRCGRSPRAVGHRPVSGHRGSG
jgi:hypothetical protein